MVAVDRPILDLAALVAALAELPDEALRPLAARLGALARPAAPAPALVTVTDAARRLDCHPKTVRAMVDRGQLRAVRVGKALRVDLASLEEVGAERATPAAPRRPRRAATREFSRRVAEEGP
jgi:excisionase family DNA binding protein